jgi:hypothetical protein
MGNVDGGSWVASVECRRVPMQQAVDRCSVPERVLLFCVASGTEWAQAGVTGATATAMLVRGLVEHDALGRLELTPRGRTVLDALLGLDET